MSELCKRCGGSGYLQDFSHMQTSFDRPCNICSGTGLMPGAVMKSHEIIPCPDCETKAKKIEELEAQRDHLDQMTMTKNDKIEELEAEGNRQADNMLKLLAKIQELEALNRNQRNHLHEAHREIVKLKA